MNEYSPFLKKSKKSVHFRGFWKCLYLVSCQWDLTNMNEYFPLLKKVNKKCSLPWLLKIVAVHVYSWFPVIGTLQI